MRTDVQSAVSVVKPVLQALVLAEQVYEDKSGKKIICGTFNRLIISRQPTVREVETPDGGTRTLIRGGAGIVAPSAYISLTDVCDNTVCDLQFVSLTRNIIIFSTSMTIRCNNRLANVEIIAPLPTLAIPEAGVYAFEVVCDGDVIGSHRIIAVDGDQPGGD